MQQYPISGIRSHVRAERGHAITGSDGSFVLDNVKAGNIELQHSPLSGRAPDRMEISVSEGDKTSVKFKLQPRLSVTGVVVDQSGSPVGGASVYFYSKKTQCWGKSKADADGKFVVDGVLPGVYEGEAQLEGRPGGIHEARIKNVQAGAKDVEFVSSVRDWR